jgi:hypothetical protein
MNKMIENDMIEFDSEGYAVHRECGTRVIEEWSITRCESYHLKRDGTATLADEGGDDKECEDIWCEKCDVQVYVDREGAMGGGEPDSGRDQARTGGDGR